MNEQIIKKSIQDSSECLINIVWPIISPMLGGGELIPVENVIADKMREQFDMLAGIDAWLLKPNVGMRGIASRVQYGALAYNTFTIRYRKRDSYDTEWEKRVRAVQDDWLHPYYTIQAYIDHKTLLSCAAIKTKDLINWAIKHFLEIKTRKNHQDSNEFIIVPWENLVHDNIEMWIYDNTQGGI